jgi:hypothetical protein
MTTKKPDSQEQPFDKVAADIESILAKGHPVGTDVHFDEVVLQGEKAMRAFYVVKQRLNGDYTLVHVREDTTYEEGVDFWLESQEVLYGQYRATFGFGEDYILETYRGNSLLESYGIGSARYIHYDTWDIDNPGGVMETDQGTMQIMIPYDERINKIMINHNEERTNLDINPNLLICEKKCKSEGKNVDLSYEECCFGLIPSIEKGNFVCITDELIQLTDDTLAEKNIQLEYQQSTINIKPGYNMFSAETGTTIEDLWGNCGVIQAWEYTNNDWKEITTFESGKGYYIYAVSECEYTIPDMTAEVEIYNGWNLVYLPTGNVKELLPDSIISWNWNGNAYNRAEDLLMPTTVFTYLN